MNHPDEAEHKLPNGGHLYIRPLRRGEYGLIGEFCARLSQRTRYLRFSSPMPVLPDSLLRMLADADAPRRVALVAELGHTNSGDVVALGNACAIDRFVVHGLWDNPALRPLLKHLMDVVSANTSFGESEITFARRATLST